MTIGVAILANKRLDRVAGLANYLSAQGLAVCIHVDAKEPDNAFLQLKESTTTDVMFTKRIVCEWGEFSLVRAELDMCRMILEKRPDVTHVQLISGDSLPIRPTANFIDFLSDHPTTDFIESFTIDSNNWIVGGLGIERFTLYFPFSWKTQRLRFDAFVNIQRKLRVRRTFPKGLTPHIGSQWWCLTRETIARILKDPEAKEIDQYFEKCWIPDESYFQTLVRRHSSKIETRSLVLSRFDHQGKPVMLYDDHLDMLKSQPEFFARKVWPGASALYNNFLDAAKQLARGDHPERSLQKQIDMATNRRKVGRKGLSMQSRAPNKWHEPNVTTANPYVVSLGYGSVIEKFDEWVEKLNATPLKVSPFSTLADEGEAELSKGGLLLTEKVAEISPACHLTNLIWQYRDRAFVFPMSVNDKYKFHKLVSQDSNATVQYIQNYWLVDLARANIQNQDFLRSEANRLLELERQIVWNYEQPKTRAKFVKFTLNALVQSPHSVVSQFQANLNGQETQKLISLPVLRSMDAAFELASKLKNIGVDIPSYDDIVKPQSERLQDKQTKS